MHSNSAPITKDLVLVGGGHSHVAVLRSLGMDPIPGLRTTLISPTPSTPYSGMIPGYLAGHYSREQAHIELPPLARMANAQFYQDAITQIDPEKKQVSFADRPPVGFNLLSIDIGSTPNLRSVPGASDHVIPVKPIDRFLSRFEAAVEQRGSQASVSIAIVGAGAGGTELVLSLQERIKNGPLATGKSVSFHLVSKSATVLPSHNNRVQSIFHRILQEREIQLHLDRAVTQVSRDRLILDGGREVRADIIVWATHAAAPRWLADCKIDTDASGFITVRDTLQSTSHPFIYAAGDIAAVVPHPRPKSGVFAVRQGPPLTRNLRRAFNGEPALPFTPQKEFLSLISTGDQYAVASRGALALEGRYLWTLKDQIDRRWMKPYQELPSMSGSTTDESAPPTPPSSQMRCAGCGSKVGGETLSRVLARIVPVERSDVSIALNTPDDAAVTSLPRGSVSVQTVDFFRSFLSDPYLFGRITANHCLSDLFAMGAEPQSALAIATVPHGSPSRVEEQLFQLLAGANATLTDCNTALAGGHTTEGSELAFGLSVQGIAKPSRLLKKSGMKTGHDLLLTKALGTGTLLAADMQNKAKGRWMTSAQIAMLQSNQSASQILLKHQASACTDVTGFGLLGHLWEMVIASQTEATVFLSTIPSIDGALETIRAGIVSTLQPENRRLLSSIAQESPRLSPRRIELLFDPQTSGGLLASIPSNKTDACLHELHQAGYTDAIKIGQVHQADSLKAPIELRHSE